LSERKCQFSNTGKNQEIPKGVLLKPEQVVAKLREIEVLLSQDKDALTASREVGATDKKVIPLEASQSSRAANGRYAEYPSGRFGS